eukprot:ctg_1125.g380
MRKPVLRAKGPCGVSRRSGGASDRLVLPGMFSSSEHPHILIPSVRSRCLPHRSIDRPRTHAFWRQAGEGGRSQAVVVERTALLRVTESHRPPAGVIVRSTARPRVGVESITGVVPEFSSEFCYGSFVGRADNGASAGERVRGASGAVASASVSLRDGSFGWLLLSVPRKMASEQQRPPALRLPACGAGPVGAAVHPAGHAVAGPECHLRWRVRR